jgi:light-regulated signal transduction histidine kinase (bacteriophytochrome)
MLGHDFNRMAEQLKSLLQTRNELLRDISHELRSPLARLQVALELGRSQLDDAAFDRIEREIERMDGLIGELLALARLEAGTVPLRRDPVDLSELLRDVCEDAAYEGAASERKVELTTDGSATLLGDPGLLQSAFDNVIRNAVRHTPSGSSVRVDLRCANREAYVTVIDSYRRALLSDPYNAEATLKLALAYDRVLRKGCALAMLRRLETLAANPTLQPEAEPMIQLVVANPHWFKPYHGDALRAVGQ